MQAVEEYPGLPHRMPPQGQPLQACNEFGMLQEAYLEHAGALRDPSSESSKLRLNILLSYLQGKGVYGNNALHLLQKYSSYISWQNMAPDVFSSFYRFVFFICREPSKRNVLVGPAVAAWRLVLAGRFRLLERWCSYVTTHVKASVILEDTWRQVLDFSRTVHEDLSNYDPASAWPVLLDEFVEHLKGQRHSHRLQAHQPEPMDLFAPWATRPMTAISPRSGSKRRPPDILEVADQLQQLPLAENSSAVVTGSHASTQAVAAATGAGAPVNQQRTMFFAAKRPRMSSVPKHTQGLAPADQLTLGQNTMTAGSPMAAFPAGSGSIGPLSPTEHPQRGRRVIAGLGVTAGFGLREIAQDCQQIIQQQGQQLYQQQQQQQQQEFSMMNEGPHQLKRQQQHVGGNVGHASSATASFAFGQLPQLPPCASPGHHARHSGFGGMRRSNSVAAIMQVTVTEALGLS